MTFKEGVVWGVVSVALFLGANSPANACTTDGWDSASGAGVAGSPAPVSRFSGLCAYELNGTQYTQDNTPSAESRYRARFYVLPKLTGAGTADVFVAYSDAGSTAVFRVRWNGTQFVFDATPAGGTSFNITAANSQWHLVEIDWQQGAGNFRAWVDGDAATDSATTGNGGNSGSVETVRLGLPGGLGGFGGGDLTVDAFVSQRTQPVGPLLLGDANNNGSINVFDLISQQNEILGNSLGQGQPDCNRNGSINVFDLICVQNIILGN